MLYSQSGYTFQSGFPEVLPAVAIGINFSTGFGHDRNALAMLLQKCADEGLAPSGTINVCCIEKVRPTFFGRIEDLVRRCFIQWSKFGSAELPASESNLADVASIPSESACVHVCGDDELGEAMRKEVVLRNKSEVCLLT